MSLEKRSSCSLAVTVGSWGILPLNYILHMFNDSHSITRIYIYSKIKSYSFKYENSKLMQACIIIIISCNPLHPSNYSIPRHSATSVTRQLQDRHAAAHGRGSPAHSKGHVRTWGVGVWPAADH